MGQYQCFCGKKKKEEISSTDEENEEMPVETTGISPEAAAPENIAVPFSYDELVAATDNLSSEYLIHQTAVGPVFKGTLVTDQVVAIQLLNPEDDIQAENEFLQEVKMLTQMRHPNLINLIGFCNQGDKRLLVSEFMPSESNLECYLHARTPEMQPLDWNTRMRIATGVARGLNFLHSEAVPPIMYKDLKSSNVLLGDLLDPKLADIRHPEVDPESSQASSSTAVMRTRGYHAPEAATGNFTFKSDVYSYGILLFELITGQQSFNDTRGRGKHFLIDWVRLMMGDWKLDRIIDPVLKGKCPEASLEKAIKLAFLCAREEPPLRPTMLEVVQAINTLMSELNAMRQPARGEGEPSNATQIRLHQPSGEGPSNARQLRVHQPSRQGQPSFAGEVRDVPDTSMQLRRRGRQQNSP